VNKLNESIAQSFAGGTRTPPSFNDAVNLTRNIANELDSARFDPLLIRSVAKNVSSALENLLGRAESNVCIRPLRLIHICSQFD
jgi:hypothetical protein